MPNNKLAAPNFIAFAERLTLVKGDESARSFAKRVGSSQTAMAQYLSGKSEPTRPVLEAIAKAASVRMEWLVTGEGPMNYPDVVDLAAEAKAEIGSSNVVLIPFYEDLRASAGPGALVNVEESRPVAFSNAWIRDVLGLRAQDLGMMRARGDSMAPTIGDGELLVFDMGEDGRRVADGIFIFRLDGNIHVKRLQRLPGDRVMIISDNHAYPPYAVEPGDGTDFAIVGKVTFRFGRV